VYVTLWPLDLCECLSSSNLCRFMPSAPLCLHSCDLCLQFCLYVLWEIAQNFNVPSLIHFLTSQISLWKTPMWHCPRMRWRAPAAKTPEAVVEMPPSNVAWAEKPFAMKCDAMERANVPMARTRKAAVNVLGVH